jgi:hypothetical protein
MGGFVVGVLTVWLWPGLRRRARLRRWRDFYD